MSNLSNGHCLTAEKNCGNPPFLLGEWQEWQSCKKPMESTPKLTSGWKIAAKRPNAVRCECLTFSAMQG
jgi:hypothetical protein